MGPHQAPDGRVLRSCSSQAASSVADRQRLLSKRPLKTARQNHCDFRANTHRPTPCPQQPVARRTCQSGRLITVVLLIRLALEQKFKQAVRATMSQQMINLLLVMVIDKSFHRCDRGINSLRAKQSRQSACQPPRQAPWPQKRAAHGHRQARLHQGQMLRFCLAVLVCKGP